MLLPLPLPLGLLLARTRLRHKDRGSGAQQIAMHFSRRDIRQLCQTPRCTFYHVFLKHACERPDTVPVPRVFGTQRHGGNARVVSINAWLAKDVVGVDARDLEKLVARLLGEQGGRKRIALFVVAAVVVVYQMRVVLLLVPAHKASPILPAPAPTIGAADPEHKTRGPGNRREASKYPVHIAKEIFVFSVHIVVDERTKNVNKVEQLTKKLFSVNVCWCCCCCCAITNATVSISSVSFARVVSLTLHEEDVNHPLSLSRNE